MSLWFLPFTRGNCIAVLVWLVLSFLRVALLLLLPSSLFFLVRCELLLPLECACLAALRIDSKLLRQGQECVVAAQLRASGEKGQAASATRQRRSARQMRGVRACVGCCCRRFPQFERVQHVHARLQLVQLRIRREGWRGGGRGRGRAHLCRRRKGQDEIPVLWSGGTRQEERTDERRAGRRSRCCSAALLSALLCSALLCALCSPLCARRCPCLPACAGAW